MRNLVTRSGHQVEVEGRAGFRLEQIVHLAWGMERDRRRARSLAVKTAFAMAIGDLDRAIAAMTHGEIGRHSDVVLIDSRGTRVRFKVVD